MKILLIRVKIVWLYLFWNRLFFYWREQGRTLGSGKLGWPSELPFGRTPLPQQLASMGHDTGHWRPARQSRGGDEAVAKWPRDRGLYSNGSGLAGRPISPHAFCHLIFTGSPLMASS